MGNIVNPATLTGRLLDSAGQPLSGTVHITPDTPIITSLTTVMTKHSIEVELDAFGAFRIELQGNNADGVTPQGFTYRITFDTYDHGREFLQLAPFSFAIGEGETKDLRDLAPITANSGNPVTSGPVGPTGPPGAAAVFVVTGAEARPTGPLIFWIGGEEQPLNMGINDLWFAPVPAVDTTPPTIPTGLSSTNIAETTFTLNWTASTDTSGVTEYEIYLGGVFKASVATNSANLTGLTAGTVYSVTVKAKDAVGNVSAASSALSVTTAAPTGTAQHSIWGATFPYTVVKNTESEPLTVANSFYSYGSSPDMNAWRVVGARIWVPGGVTMSQGCTMSLWHGQATSLATTPANSATLSSLVAGQWNEVIFPTPTETATGDVIWIGYRFANGDMLSTTEVSDGSFLAAADGSHIVLSEGTVPRSRFKYDSGSSSNATANIQYAIDIIYDEGPA